MMHFEYSSQISAPVDVIFGFHQRPDALELLTRPGDKVQLVSREGGLEVGARVEFRIALRPLKLRWVAHHIAYEKNRLFIAKQREGPLTVWVHALI
jgi:ligand-binding SRPBCC domain-containing protein